MGTKTTTPKDAALHLPQEYDEDSMLTATTTLSSSTDPREKCVAYKRHKIVPIIFIPGIMGTNLMNMKTKKRVWVAPNMDGLFPVVKTLGLLFGSWFKSSKQRQAELDSTPGALGVYEEGELDDAGSGLSTDEMRTRKWGAIMRSAYHPIMGEMQRQMNNILLNNDLQGEWKERVSQAPGDWGDWENNPSLAAMGDASGLKNAADTQYEVWAAGYNWLQSNRDSAKDIINFINNTVLPHYSGKAGNVIIVTHSMGGLVARAMVACHGFCKLYGIIHGAMPATGAPASYKRVRAGFEALAEKKILGRDAADGVAVMAFANGPLELLPSHDYNDGEPWLFAKDKSSLERVLRLPEQCPYEEIYKSEKWWGLIPEQNNKLFDPAGVVSAREQKPIKLKKAESTPPSMRRAFCDVIDEVKVFHATIEKAYHTNTFVHYAAESKSPKLYTWGTIEWSANSLQGLDIKTANLSSDNLDAEITLNGLYTLSIGPGYYPGDGTVPAFSSSAPRGKRGVQGAFAHGQNGGLINHYCKVGAFNNTAGYGHQDAYTDKAGRTQFATLYSLVRISNSI
ncbi:triacylglycerol lipase [Pseudomonas sp. URMO17WK12:I11]|uniref:esterase/lipase family protein n=1 Tax=Pseudomonas sp. URMO17WK12:I11 TaxID=1283291 RepID=UPI0011A95F2C|nr:alpha/beta hydrolase [Pseudomonas sp. URMO17WK12:I11]